MGRFILLVLLCWSAAAGAMGQADPIVDGPAGVQLISHQFSFTEGASVDRKGNVFFTDQPNDKIWEYDVKGRLRIFMDSAGRSNGMYFDHRGWLVTCADEKDELWAISPHRKVRVLLRDFGGLLFNGPNDLWIDTHGGIYFTDPYYQRSYWTRTKLDLDGERVYYLPPGASQARVVVADLVKPNGIVGTPDGKYLYVADIGAGKTYKYPVRGDGVLGAGELFVSQGSDGMTLDERGDVYLTGDGVTVYNPAGQEILHIPVPEKWTANLCLGGRDKKTLFITASGGLYCLRMLVKGVE